MWQHVLYVCIVALHILRKSLVVQKHSALSSMPLNNWELRSAAFSDDLEGVQELCLAQKDISDLEGIQAVANVRYLSLSFNSVKSLRGIGALQQLRTLNVMHNSLTSLQALAALPELLQLNVSHNALCSLAPVTGCMKLEELRCHCNDIALPSEVTVLSELKQLRRLCLQPNPISSQLAAAYRPGTIALLSTLEGLDGVAVSEQEQEQRGAYSSVYVAACSASAAHTPSNLTPEPGAAAPMRVKAPPLSADKATLQDISSMLPDVKVPTTKPRSIPAPKPKKEAAPAAVRQVPTVSAETRYARGSQGVALVTRTDGSATAFWPGGDAAVTLDTDEDGLFKLFAVYKSGNVALSVDAAGGFVQYANGSLLMNYNRTAGSGTWYSQRSEQLLKWSERSGAPPERDVEAVLDEGLAMHYMPRKGELRLQFTSCEVCKTFVLNMKTLKAASVIDAVPGGWPQSAADQGAVHTPEAVPERKPSIRRDTPKDAKPVAGRTEAPPAAAPAASTPAMPSAAAAAAAAGSEPGAVLTGGTAGTPPRDGESEDDAGREEQAADPSHEEVIAKARALVAQLSRNLTPPAATADVED